MQAIKAYIHRASYASTKTGIQRANVHGR